MPAAVCRLGLCLCCSGVRRCLSGVKRHHHIKVNTKRNHPTPRLRQTRSKMGFNKTYVVVGSRQKSGLSKKNRNLSKRGLESRCNSSSSCRGQVLSAIRVRHRATVEPCEVLVGGVRLGVLSCACVCRCQVFFLCRCVLCACDLLIVLHETKQLNAPSVSNTESRSHTRRVHNRAEGGVRVNPR